jgi:hypothetical protein
MPLFTVLNYKDGGPDGDPQQIEAPNEQAAAERVCGVLLVEGFKLIDLRALVSPVSAPKVRKLFRLPIRVVNASRPSS